MQERRIALVLGLQLNPDGTLSTEFRERIARGVYLIESGRVDLIVISGGDTLKKYPSEAATALEMVPERSRRSCLIEEESLSTQQNILHTKELLRGHGIKPISIRVICSNGQWHWRTKQMFAKLWPEARVSAEIVGTETAKDTLAHILLYAMTMMDTKEKVFLPLKRWLLNRS